MAKWLFERLFFPVFVALVFRWWAGLLGGAVFLYMTYLAYEHAVKQWAAGGDWVRAVLIGVSPGIMSFYCVKWGLMNLFFGDKWWLKDGGPEDGDQSIDRFSQGTPS
jgi:hypothetical protein